MNKLKYLKWHAKLFITDPSLYLNSYNNISIRFILGTARSGTSWISKVISKSPTLQRFYMEPLYHFKPKLPFSNNMEHTGISINRKLNFFHPLVHAYSILATKSKGHIYEVIDPKHLDMFIDNNGNTLVKEVHSLLATEGIIRFYNQPILMVQRYPLYVLDSLFSRDGFKTLYLINEEKYIFDSNFLRIYIPNYVKIDYLKKIIRETKNNRSGKILRKLITVSLIHHMFQYLDNKYENALLISYERTCHNPGDSFADYMKFLKLKWSNKNEKFLTSTSNKTIDFNDPHSIYRDTTKQLNREFKFLNKSDLELCNSVMERSGLNKIY